MALLDLQTMETEEYTGGGSMVSLLLCASQASIALCL
ncbi:SapB/AmfS family lanthipeptide [Streptomyces sp. NPDC012935]